MLQQLFHGAPRLALDSSASILRVQGPCGLTPDRTSCTIGVHGAAAAAGWWGTEAMPDSIASMVRAHEQCKSAPDRSTAALQAHMGRLELPITDYVGDTKSALDNSVRILQAITDVAADAGWLGTMLATMRLIQGLMQVLAAQHVCKLLHIV